ncbi:hypothetical protein ACO0LF_10640 [Undibacterium sp. Di27W]|uniref:hypothetical protein n=1 Tax=Undibacterium sp. Di27W TaxID=3413036 RepID=UPI003BF2664E
MKTIEKSRVLGFQVAVELNAEEIKNISGGGISGGFEKPYMTYIRGQDPVMDEPD